LQVLEQSFQKEPAYVDGIRKTLETISKGRQIADGLRDTQLFPDGVADTVAVGEEVGRVADCMERIAENYRERLDRFIQDLSSMIEPVLIVVVGLVVGTILAAVFLPMIELSQIRPG
ncbi:MAG: type II secretion system F family protein, partial [Elusimicrobia bacterium]|nr:type II secretion system F family protein [Elusimicrobiota bacterium]